MKEGVTHEWYAGGGLDRAVLDFSGYTAALSTSSPLGVKTIGGTRLHDGGGLNDHRRQRQRLDHDG